MSAVRRPEPVARCNGLSWTLLLMVVGLLLAVVVAPAPARANLKGDLDDDGVVASADLMLLFRNLREDVPLTEEEHDAADLAPVINGVSTPDGEVGAADAVVLMRLIAGLIGPSAPVLDQITAPSDQNPISVTGTADPDAVITLFANGVVRGTPATANGNGDFTFTNVAVFDGDNAIRAVAVVGGLTSPQSGAVHFVYQNNIPRSVPRDATLTGYNVWTPGDPAEPYLIGSCTQEEGCRGWLTIDAGATLHLLPGTELRFQGNLNETRLTVNGKLVIEGGEGPVDCSNPEMVKITNQDDQQGSDFWGSIIFGTGNQGAVIDHACIRYFAGFWSNGDVDLTLRESHISHTYSGSMGVVLAGGGHVDIRDNLMTHIANTAVNLNNGVEGKVANNTIKYWGSGGIALLNGSSNVEVTGNYVSDRYTGLRIGDSSPTVVTGNVLEDNRWGVHVSGDSTPLLSGGNRIRWNCRGVVLDGGAPAPILNWNSIQDNEGHATNPHCSTIGTLVNYWIGNHQQGEDFVLDAQYNWWGTIDAGEIANSISRGTGDPIVDFQPYLDDEDGDPTGDNFLTGLIDSDTTLGPDEDYEVVGDLIVAENVVLTILDGTNLNMGEDAKLRVLGSLDVQGQSGSQSGCDNENAVVFTSSEAASPARNDWQMIEVPETAAPGDVTIDYACIEYMYTGVDITNRAVAISNTEIREFYSAGVVIKQGDGTTISNSIIDNSDGGIGGTGVSVPQASMGLEFTNNVIRRTYGAVKLNSSSPMMEGNILEENYIGVQISGTSSPVITNQNRIRFNCAGIFLGSGYGEQAQPVVTWNSIHDNDTTQGVPCSSTIAGNYVIDSYSNGGMIELDATNNWWNAYGLDIADGIKRSAGEPIINFVPFLDAEDGIPTGEGEFILGFVGAATVLQPQVTVVDDLVVPPGDTWTIGAGTTLTIAENVHIDVLGDLVIAGAAGSPVILQPSPGVKWWGIKVSSGSSADIAWTEISDAWYPIDIDNGELYLSDTSVATAGAFAIRMFSASAASFIQASTISGPGYGTGIDLDESSPTISGTTIDGFTTGILVTGALSQPTIGTAGNGNDILDFSNIGIWMQDGVAGTIEDNLIDSEDPAKQAAAGIQLEDSSPAIIGNEIHYTKKGIYLKGQSSPVINGYNTIWENEVGIVLEGTGQSGEDPDPVINQNNIYGNDNANLQTQGFSSAAATIDAEENWWGSDVPGEIRSLMLSELDKPVMVGFSNYLDQENGSPTASPGLYSLLLTGVIPSADHIAPTLGEFVTIDFLTPSDLVVDIVLRIYPEKEYVAWEEQDPPGSPMPNAKYTETRLAQTGGPQSIPWYGKEDGNLTFVPDEAYIYEIEVTDAGSGFSSTYNPPLVPGNQGGSQGAPLPTSYNPYRNEFFKVVYVMSGGPGRVSYQITPDGKPMFEAFTDKPIYDGSHLITYDGRDENGLLLEDGNGEPFSGNVHFWFPVPKPLKRNYVIVERTTAAIRGPEYESPAPQVPNVEVKANPYLITHSYDQVLGLEYCIDQDALVTVTVLKPGTADPENPANVAATLVGPDQPLSGVDCVTTTYSLPAWDGRGASGKGFIEEDGLYTFAIEARHPSQPDLKSLYRGVMQLRQ